MKLAREGWEIAGVAAAVTAAATFAGGLSAWPLWVLFVLIAQFFREPARAVAGGDDVVLSPADGRVVYVGAAESPLPDGGGGGRVKISVFMNVFNVHVNRAPVSGEVTRSQRFAGAFFNAALDKASARNERHLLGVKTAFGEVLCMQIAGLLARRVLCYANVGDSLQAGGRYGFIRFGSRVDVYLPPECRPMVSIGDKVTAGVDRIAQPPPPAETA